MVTEKVCSESEIIPVELEVVTLTLPVHSKFCITWSCDDKIAIIAEGGVFIFELWPSPFNDNPTLALLKYTIQSSALLSHANVSPDRNTYLWSLNRKEAFETAFDVTMSGFSEKPEGHGVFPIIKCEFSPLIQNKSYIACLTSDGSVEVFGKEFQTFKSIINVSQLWKSFCQSDISCDSDQTDLSRRKSRGKITEMKWHCDKTRMFFLTSHEHGILCVWELKQNDYKLSMSVKSCIRLNHVFCSITLESLESSRFTLLIAGLSSGQVKAYYLDLCSGLIEKEFFIWPDEDMMAPDLVKTAPAPGGGFLVLTVKRHVLLVSSIAISDSKKMTLFKTEILKFPTAICALSEWKQNFLVTLINHSIYCLNVENMSLNHSLKSVHIEGKERQKNSYHCHGLAMSANKVIWMMVSSAKINYDALKEVTLLTIYSTKEKNFKNLRDSTLSGLIDKIMSVHKEVKLYEIADLLELKRIELINDESKFKGNYQSKGNESLLELKLMLWEARLKCHCSPNETDSGTLNLEIEIAKQHARNMALKFEEFNEKSVVERRSQQMTLDFLSNFENKEKAHGEKCSVCGCEAHFESVRVSSCVNNHKFPRCCISLLPCDQFPYAVCQNCSSVALAEFVSGSENYCLYCDGSMIFNVRLNAIT